MPVSGNEEMVKPSVGQFSEYTAGIPIKKRRFPFILSSSQPPEDLSSLPTENELKQKGFSSTLRVSTVLNDGTVAASSNTSDVLASSNTSGIAGNSETSVLNADGVAPSLNAGNFAANSNASGVAMSSTAGSVVASSNSSGVAMSSSVSSVGLSSTPISVAARLDTGSVVEKSNASGVAMSSTAISALAGSSNSRTVENVNATSIAGSVSCFSDASEKSVLEQEKKSSDSLVQGNSNILRVKLEDQSFSVQSRFLADIESKGKIVDSGASDNIRKKSAKSELDLVGHDSLVFNIGKDMYSQTSVEGKFGSQLPTVSGNPGLSLGSREYLPAMASRNNEQVFQIQGKTEPVSLNLSLSKGEFSTQLKSSEVQHDNTKGANLLADRTNWDLNTPMDSWEGPASEDDASHISAHMDVADMKPVICSAGTTPATMPTRQQIPEGICSAKIEMPSILSNRQYSAEDSLRLGLTTPCLHLNPNEKASGSSAKVVSGKVAVSISSPGESAPGSKPSMVNYKPVKSEPLDEGVKSDSAGIQAKSIGLLDISRQVKSEQIEKCSSERLNSSTPSTLNSIDVRSLKPEPVCESKKETLESMESEQQMLALPTVTDSSLHGDVTTHAEHSMQAKVTEPTVECQAASEMTSSAGHDVNEPNIASKIDSSTSQIKKVTDPDHCRLKSMDVQPPDSRGLAEGSVSDEEKINLSGDVLEEDSYGSDYESDDKQHLAAAMDVDHDRRAEDDFEDGEVREPVVNAEVEVPKFERQEAGNGNNTNTSFNDFVGFVGDNNPSSSCFTEKETRREDPGITSNDATDTSVNKDSIADADKEVCLHGVSAVEMLSSPIDRKGPVEAIPRNVSDLSEMKDTVKGQEGELASIRSSDIQETSEAVGQGEDDANKTDSEGKINSFLPKEEAFPNNDDAGKDVDSGGSRSRIINLPRASNLSSPGRTRSISGRTLQSQVGRERLPDVALEGGDKFHPRGRDEAYADSSHRFSRERHHIQPPRNNRISFMRGRGRISSRIDTLHGDQDSECNFASEFSTEFCAVRHKYTSAVSDADLNFSSCNNGRDGAYFGTGRGGRKILNDDPSGFTQLPPRRRSPCGRDGPAGRGFQMVRRVPRNLSPSRCVGEDGSELVGLRHVRGFANDHTDQMFARCQPSFEGLNGPFVRGNREFTSVQRRGLPRTRSKSPTRPRTRSPGPWSSIRRRSPDGFGGPSELPHRRSPIYRMERIRSPDSPCFAGEMGIRRHGSPQFMSRPSNDLRDLDPGRDHGHPRTGISNRNPSGRILLRNNRRLDLVDPRERNEGDEYFGGPMPSGRFHELGADGNADERRRYGDRRGPVRPFRPPYSVADSENFHVNAEGGPRSFRFCPEEDPELHGRGNMREREFDRRIKNRPGNAPRRTRNIQEQEGNFRHGGQVWHEDGFEDTSQVKRKRF